MKTYKIGIIGCGNIAKKMALTLGGMKHVERYAVASRSKEKAETFAGEWQFTKAYGSYEELIKDPHVDLIYIATPHSEHYEHARLCILNQKPVLCEKAFTANARQAEELLNLAKEHQVFITEAIWTRYMPLSQKIRELIEQGAIGNPIPSLPIWDMSFRTRSGSSVRNWPEEPCWTSGSIPSISRP